MSRAEFARDHFADQFDRFESQLGQAEPAEPGWLAPIRRAAIERFGELGMPTRRNEAWKYTNIAPIADAGFVPATRGNSTVSRDDIVRLFGIEAAECCLVFENGQWVQELSRTNSLPDGVSATGLSGLLRDESELARALIAPAAEAESLSRPFFALNLAFQSDGAFVRISSSLDRPLELLFVHSPQANGRFNNPRNWIAVEAGACATISMRYASLADDTDAYLTNAVTSVSLAAGAQLDLVTVQHESEAAMHLASIDVEQQRDSHFRSHLISLGARLARSEVNARLTAPGAECTLNGLFVADGTQHVDNQTLIDHATPHGTSRELYKGICGGRSRGVFNGMVRVQPDAQKTDAQQSNPNLLTSDRAQINTKPTLEIYADDVKCSHGATIGRLDEEALFYLRSRGISALDAHRILTGAFAAEVADAIPDVGLREHVSREVAAKLARSAAKEAA